MGTLGCRLGSNPWRLWPALYGLKWRLGLGLLLALLSVSDAIFYLPGFVPVNYCEAGSETPSCQSSVDVFVKRLHSKQSSVPFEYYSFDFCEGSAQNRSSENLGQLLSGERMLPSPYKFSFNKTENCTKVCVKSYDPDNKSQKFKWNLLKRSIILNYQHHWVIDNLPLIWCQITEDRKHYCTAGFPLGYFRIDGISSDDPHLINPKLTHGTLYLFNHVDITIIYHRESDIDGVMTARLINARVNPKSYKHSDENHLVCDGPPMEIPRKDQKLRVTYTYSVKFEETNDVTWSSRWDYFSELMSNTENQWFRLVNGFIVAIVLCGIAGVAILKCTSKDPVRSNDVKTSVDAQVESGRNIRSEDTFKPAKNPILLSVFVGQGTQILIMLFVSLCLACRGYLFTTNRSVIMTYAGVCWVFLGTSAGYMSAKLYNTLNGKNWMLHFLLTALLFPGIVFADLYFMNVMLCEKGSSAAIPFEFLRTILISWVGFLVPLTLLGEYIGRKKKFDCSTHVNQVSHELPQQSCVNTFCNMLVGGILPFICVCIFLHLYSILSNIWSHEFYFLFGFLILAFLVLLVICAIVPVLLCCLRFHAEDSFWWWKAFSISGFASLYVLIYSIYYFSKLQITHVAGTILYFGYTMIILLLFFLLTGTCGFLSALWFIYSN